MLKQVFSAADKFLVGAFLLYLVLSTFLKPIDREISDLQRYIEQSSSSEMEWIDEQFGTLLKLVAIIPLPPMGILIGMWAGVIIVLFGRHVLWFFLMAWNKLCFGLLSGKELQMIVDEGRQCSSMQEGANASLDATIRGASNRQVSQHVERMEHAIDHIKSQTTAWGRSNPTYWDDYAYYAFYSNGAFSRVDGRFLNVSYGRCDGRYQHSRDLLILDKVLSIAYGTSNPELYYSSDRQKRGILGDSQGALQYLGMFSIPQRVKTLAGWAKEIGILHLPARHGNTIGIIVDRTKISSPRLAIALVEAFCQGEAMYDSPTIVKPSRAVRRFDEAIRALETLSYVHDIPRWDGKTPIDQWVMQQVHQECSKYTTQDSGLQVH